MYHDIRENLRIHRLAYPAARPNQQSIECSYQADKKVDAEAGYNNANDHHAKSTRMLNAQSPDWSHIIGILVLSSNDRSKMQHKIERETTVAQRQVEECVMSSIAKGRTLLLARGALQFVLC